MLLVVIHSRGEGEALQMDTAATIYAIGIFCVILIIFRACYSCLCDYDEESLNIPMPVEIRRKRILRRPNRIDRQISEPTQSTDRSPSTDLLSISTISTGYLPNRVTMSMPMLPVIQEGHVSPSSSSSSSELCDQASPRSEAATAERNSLTVVSVNKKRLSLT